MVCVMFAQPKEELPIDRREQFLLVRRAGGDFDQLANRAMAFAGARADSANIGGTDTSVPQASSDPVSLSPLLPGIPA